MNSIKIIFASIVLTSSCSSFPIIKKDASGVISANPSNYVITNHDLERDGNNTMGPRVQDQTAATQREQYLAQLQRQNALRRLEEKSQEQHSSSTESCCSIQ